jgi:monofunctional biosynthetic peptidoglycan transglycosylase
VAGASTVTILDFTDAARAADLAPIDDAVMGGRSWSSFTHGPGFAVFAGEVSLENGGGFASVRSAPLGLDLSAADGLELRVRGDGRSYKLNLRTERSFDGVTWQARFETVVGEWRTVALPFTAFTPVHRGRPVPGAAPLDRRRVETVGLLVSDRQAGPFRLEVARLSAFTGHAAEAGPGGGEPSRLS